MNEAVCKRCGATFPQTRRHTDQSLCSAECRLDALRELNVSRRGTPRQSSEGLTHPHRAARLNTDSLPLPVKVKFREYEPCLCGGCHESPIRQADLVSVTGSPVHAHLCGVGYGDAEALADLTRAVDALSDAEYQAAAVKALKGGAK